MLKKRYVDVRDGQIHLVYCEKGEGVPTVFLHQTASSSKMYQSVMERLSGKAPMYALDTPGFGGSYRPPTAPSTRYYVESLMQAIDALGIGSFNLFGHHTGAAIACEMAAVYPDRILKLGMIGPVQLTAEERNSWKSAAAIPLTIDARATHFDEVWHRVTHLDQQPIKYAPSVELATREAIDTLIAGDRWHEAYVAVFEQDFPAFFEQVNCPVLMICGEADVLYPYFERACHAKPDAKIVNAVGGAYLLDQKPDEMATLIEDFFFK